MLTEGIPSPPLKLALNCIYTDEAMWLVSYPSISVGMFFIVLVARGVGLISHNSGGIIYLAFQINSLIKNACKVLIH